MAITLNNFGIFNATRIKRMLSNDKKHATYLDDWDKFKDFFKNALGIPTKKERLNNLFNYLNKNNTNNNQIIHREKISKFIEITKLADDKSKFTIKEKKNLFQNNDFECKIDGTVICEITQANNETIEYINNHIDKFTGNIKDTNLNEITENNDKIEIPYLNEFNATTELGKNLLERFMNNGILAHITDDIDTLNKLVSNPKIDENDKNCISASIIGNGVGSCLYKSDHFGVIFNPENVTIKHAAKGPYSVTKGKYPQEKLFEFSDEKTRMAIKFIYSKQLYRNIVFNKDNINRYSMQDNKNITNTIISKVAKASQKDVTREFEEYQKNNKKIRYGFISPGGVDNKDKNIGTTFALNEQLMLIKKAKEGNHIDGYIYYTSKIHNPNTIINEKRNEFISFKNEVYSKIKKPVFIVYLDALKENTIVNFEDNELKNKFINRKQTFYEITDFIDSLENV